MKRLLVYMHIRLEFRPGVGERRQGGEAHILTADGMDKGNLVGEQGDLPLAAAVFAIPQKGMLAGGELHPDLVGASRVQADVHQRIARFCG